MGLFRAIALVLALLTASGCVHPYKLEVRQGNIITPEMTEKLKPGLTRSQVRFLLGTPLITDPFHPERWDYVYLYKKHAGAPAETRHLTVIFNGDTVAQLEGDLAPGAAASGEHSADTADNAGASPPSSPSARSL